MLSSHIHTYLIVHFLYSFPKCYLFLKNNYLLSANVYSSYISVYVYIFVYA